MKGVVEATFASEWSGEGDVALPCSMSGTPSKLLHCECAGIDLLENQGIASEKRIVVLQKVESHVDICFLAKYVHASSSKTHKLS